MTTHPTNADRAVWAKEALAAFTTPTYSGDHPDSMHGDDLETAISDLIADLMHFARQQRFDIGSLLQQAISNFICDIVEEAAL